MKREQLFKSINFTRQQSIILGVLGLLLVSSYIITLFYKPVLSEKPMTYNLDEIITKKDIQVDSTAKEKINKLTSGKKESKGKVYIKRPPEYVTFNPNSTDSLTWLKMGLSPFTIKVINNYLDKGGQFWDCEGLKKIYSLDSITYLQILPYCNIPKKSRKPKYPKFKKSYTKDSLHKPYVPKPRPKVDIAIADTTELMSLYGIGPTLSKRIIKYRNSLGGFHSIDQLGEVWGLEEEVINEFSSRLIITPSIKKVNINDDPTNLVNHPYINWSHARIIARYIDQHGAITDLETLRQLHGLPQDMIENILPYLDF